MLNAMSPMTLMWLVALILFGIAEAATVGLVSIWFAVGTIPALIVSALGGPCVAAGAAVLSGIYFDAGDVKTVCAEDQRPKGQNQCRPSYRPDGHCDGNH